MNALEHFAALLLIISIIDAIAYFLALWWVVRKGVKRKKNENL